MTQQSREHQWPGCMTAEEMQMSLQTDSLADIEADISRALSKVAFNEQSYIANVKRLNEQYKEFMPAERSAKPISTQPYTRDAGNSANDQWKTVPTSIRSSSAANFQPQEFRPACIESVVTATLKPYIDSLTPASIALSAPLKKVPEKGGKPVLTPGENICQICCAESACVALIPCGHTGLCSGCSRKLKVCPFCQTRITETLVLQKPN